MNFLFAFGRNFYFLDEWPIHEVRCESNKNSKKMKLVPKQNLGRPGPACFSTREWFPR